MKFLHTLWPFSRVSVSAGIGADGSASAPPATDAGANSGNTGTVASGTGAHTSNAGAGSIGFGARPNIPGSITWVPETGSVAWAYPIGTAPVPLPEEELEGWFPGDATYHAPVFLSALIAWGYGGKSIYQPLVVELYKVMCRRLRCEPGPWIKIAAELRRITKTKRKSAWCRFSNDKRRRMYVYAIPAALPAQGVVATSYLAGAVGEERSAVA